VTINKPKSDKHKELSLADKVKLINESQGKSQRQLATKVSTGKSTANHSEKKEMI